MQDCGFPVANVPVRNDIRLNLTITDRHGLTVKLNEIGPRLSRGEVSSVEGTVEAQLGRASWLMLCGSLPPGVPSDFYAQLISRAAKRGVKTLLDTDGEALSEGVEAGPTIVTPNQQEAERLLNTVLLTRSHSLAAVAADPVDGRGDGGPFTRQPRGRCRPRIGLRYGKPRPRAWMRSRPSAQAMRSLPLLAWSLANGDEFPEALRWGVAAGSASAQLPGVNFATLDQTREVRDDVEVNKVAV